MTRRQALPSSPAFEAVARGARFRDLIAVVVRASPEVIFQALHDITLRDMTPAWLLGELRYLPSRLAGRMPASDSTRPFLSTLLAGGTLVLRDESPREVITGSAAQLHRVHQRPRRFASREAFEAFANPGYDKLFMSVRVTPAGRPGEYWLVLEHATLALSPIAERKFARYWRMIKPLGAFVSWQLLRAVRRRAERAMAGASSSRLACRSVRATAHERTRALPGDERIPTVIDTLTHAVTIRRPPRDVWPWLVQMGAGSRGGWYSYDWLDNHGHRSATRIVPELQHPAIGSIFPAMPGATEGFTLLAIEPERVLTLGWLRPDGAPQVTWTFVLDEVGPGVTRLLVRARAGESYRFRGLPLPLTTFAIRIVHFIMQRKQLLGIAGRAEAVLQNQKGGNRQRIAPPRTAWSLMVLMIVQALLGLLRPDDYRDVAWIRAAWYGNDWITLVGAVPLLWLGTVHARRGSVRGRLLVLGMAWYAIYNYAFYLFGAALNIFFPLYIACFLLGVVTLWVSASRFDAVSVAKSLGRPTPVRLIGGYLVCVAAGLAAIWLGMWGAYAFAGRPTPIEPEAFKVVAALDLCLMVPALAGGGVMLWRRRPSGYLIATVAAIQGSLYLLVLSVNTAIAIGRGLVAAPGELVIWAPLTLFTTIAAVVLIGSASGKAADSESPATPPA